MIDPRRWHPAVRWLAIRIAALPVIFVVVSFLSFFLIFGPLHEDPAILIRGQGATEDQLDEIREALDLDGRWYVNYVQWLGSTLQGDFGTVPRNGEPVADELDHRVAPSVEIMIIAAIVATGVGLALAAVDRRGGLVRAVARVMGAILVSVPVFVSVILAIIYPSKWWGYAPPRGGYVSLLDESWNNLELLMPPAVLLGVATAPIFAFTLRGAWERVARGVPVRAIMNALAVWFPFGASGLIVAERVYSIEGLGLLFFQSTFIRDLTTTHVLLTATTFVAVALWLFAPRTPVAATAEPGERELGALLRDPILVVGAAMLGLVILAALIGPIVVRDDPRVLSVTERYVGPSWDHPFGTNQLGQDMLSRTLHGARHSFTVALFVGVAGFVPGALVGIAYARLRRAQTSALGAIARLLLAQPAGWWVLTMLIVSNFSWRSAYIGLAVPAFAIGMLSVSRRDAHDDLGRSIRPMAAALCTAVAFVALGHATIQFLVGSFGQPSLGFEISQGVRFSAEYPHLLWFPFGALFVLLFSLVILAASLYPRLR